MARIFSIPVTLAAALLLSAAGVPSGSAQAQPRRPGAAPVERLSKMPPKQRQRLLERLPPDRRQKVENRLEQYNSLPPAQRQRLENDYEAFRNLPPERQNAIRGIFRDFNDLPQDRRPLVRQEFARLRRMPVEQRARRLNAKVVRERFNDDERKLLDRFAETMPYEPPPPKPGDTPQLPPQLPADAATPPQQPAKP